MQTLVLLYALTVLTCIILLKPFREIFSLGKKMEVSRFAIICILILLFMVVYFFWEEVASPSSSSYYVLFLCVNFILFLFIPAAYLCVRNQVYGHAYNRSDLVHTFPGIIYFLILTSFSVPKTVSGSVLHSVVLPPPSAQTTAYLISIYGYCVIGIYSIMVIKIVWDDYRRIIKQANSLAHGENYQSVREPLASKPTEKIVQVGSTSISTEQLLKMDDAVKNFLSANKPFLKRGYSLRQLSVDTGIPVHHLSAFINQYYGINFNDFINEYRVDYCKGKIRDLEWRYKTLEGIAEESGFNNRNTFTTAFKKATGYNPSDFLRKMKSDNNGDI